MLPNIDPSPLLCSAGFDFGALRRAADLRAPLRAAVFFAPPRFAAPFLAPARLAPLAPLRPAALRPAPLRAAPFLPPALRPLLLFLAFFAMIFLLLALPIGA